MRLRSLLPLALSLLAAPASAQSLYGPGGLFLHPTASVPPKGKLTPAILVLPQHNPVFDDTRTWISGTLDYGLTDDLEIGATVVKVSGWERDASAGGFLKYRFWGDDAGTSAAVGFTQLGGGEVDTRLGFLAVRHAFSQPGARRIVGHLGVQYVDYIDAVSKHEFQPYAGIEIGLSSRLSFIAEGRPRMSQEFGTPLALTLSYRPSEDWTLALTWANNGLSDTPKFGFGAGYTLGSRR